MMMMMMMMMVMLMMMMMLLWEYFVDIADGGEVRDKEDDLNRVNIFVVVVGLEIVM